MHTHYDMIVYITLAVIAVLVISLYSYWRTVGGIKLTTQQLNHSMIMNCFGGKVSLSHAINYSLYMACTIE